MKSLFVFCAMTLLVGCSAMNTQPVKKEVCEGSLVKGCSPVVYFDVGSYELNEDTKRNLDWTVEKMKRWEEKRVVIIGYTDPTGEDSMNQKLSKDRANAVGEYLFQHGIVADRIGVGYRGKKDLICEDPACYEVNRRATVKIFNQKHWWIF